MTSPSGGEKDGTEGMYLQALVRWETLHSLKTSNAGSNIHKNKVKTPVMLHKRSNLYTNLERDIRHLGA